MHIAMIVLILVVVAESSIFRPLIGYEHPMLILNAELVVIGLSLLVETIAFFKLSRKLFEDDFTEEQHFFLVSLIVFLTTYAVRCTNVILVICLFDTYVDWFQNAPTSAAFVQLSCHLIYDLSPIMIILLRHRRTF